MKKYSIVAMILFGQSLSAQVPALFNYQGRLMNGTNLVNGTVGLQLSLYDSASGGTLVYTDSNSVTVVDGLYSTYIGDHTTFGNLASALGGTQLWLQVVANGTALSPRERLVSVPYALGAPASGISGTLSDTQLSTNVARLYVPNTAQQATAVPQVVNGFVVGATVTFGGVGYVTAPAVTVNGTGVNASVTATISNGAVVGLSVGNPGSSYPTNTTLTIAPPPSNAYQIFSGINYFNGINTMTNANNVFAGNGAGLTNLNAWRLDGNAGIGTNQFIGTTDTNQFQIRVRNEPVYAAVFDEGYTAGIEAPKITQGHPKNQIGAYSGGAVIAGGGSLNYPNAIAAFADHSFIGSGQKNSIGQSSGGSFIGGGFNNTIESNCFDAVIAGGNGNKIEAGSSRSAILGGTGNIIASNSTRAAIMGGQGNIVSNDYAVITGGYFNRASGLYSFAAGYGAFASDYGSIVFSTPGEDSYFTSITNNEIAFRAVGGMRIKTVDGLMTISADGKTTINSTNNQYSVEVGSTNQLSMRVTGNNTAGTWVSIKNDSVSPARNWSLIVAGSGNAEEDGAFFVRDQTAGSTRMVVRTNGFVGIGITNPTNLLHVGGTVQATLVVQSSDRNAKENIQPVEPGDILAKVVALPVSTWTFNEESNGTHIGPMAQDFHAAFGFGNSDTTIATVDADGVALAAIQALAKENEELRQRLEVLEQKMRTDP